jgi:hypothetical protein
VQNNNYKKMSEIESNLDNEEFGKISIPSLTILVAGFSKSITD